VKVFLTGRPGKVEFRKNLVITTLRYTPVNLTLPKGTPQPPSRPTLFTVYIGGKQWRRVARMLEQNADDALVIEGFSLPDPAFRGIAVHALKVTTRQMEANRRAAQKQEAEAKNAAANPGAAPATPPDRKQQPGKPKAQGQGQQKGKQPGGQKPSNQQKPAPRQNAPQQRSQQPGGQQNKGPRQSPQQSPRQDTRPAANPPGRAQTDQPAAPPQPAPSASGFRIPPNAPPEVAQRLRDLITAANQFRQKVADLESKPKHQQTGLDITRKLLENTERQIDTLIKKFS